MALKNLSGKEDSNPLEHVDPDESTTFSLSGSEPKEETEGGEDEPKIQGEDAFKFFVVGPYFTPCCVLTFSEKTKKFEGR